MTATRPGYGESMDELTALIEAVRAGVGPGTPVVMAGVVLDDREPEELAERVVSAGFWYDAYTGEPVTPAQVREGLG